MPPAICARYSPKAQLSEQLLRPPEAARRFQARRPSQHLPKGFDIGGKPGEAMAHRLLGIEAAGSVDAGAHGGAGMVQEALGRRYRLAAARRQARPSPDAGGFRLGL